MSVTASENCFRRAVRMVSRLSPRAGCRRGAGQGGAGGKPGRSCSERRLRRQRWQRTGRGADVLRGVGQARCVEECGTGQVSCMHDSRVPRNRDDEWDVRVQCLPHGTEPVARAAPEVVMALGRSRRGDSWRVEGEWPLAAGAKAALSCMHDKGRRSRGLFRKAAGVGAYSSPRRVSRSAFRVTPTVTPLSSATLRPPR